MRTSSFLLLVCIACALESVTPALPTILVKNSKLFVNDKEYVVKGVNYSPAPLGQETMSNGYGGGGLCSAKLTPWDEWKSACYDSDYYDGSTDVNPARFPRGFKPLWERDFPKIKQLGANTIRLYNTNPSTRWATQEFRSMFDYKTGKDHTQFLKYCEDNGLMVIYPLFTDDWSYNNLDEYTFKRYLRWQIDEAASSSAILMWQFGNEMGWLWYGSSTWNDPVATAKFNRYLAYIRRYTLTRWGRNIPVTCAIPNFSDQYNYQYQNWHVDIFSANVFFNNYDGLFSGYNDFLGVNKLSCIYNKPFLMTEIGPTWAQGVSYSPGAFNEIWANVVKNMPYGLLGAVWFEFSDEPALNKDFGLFSFDTNTVNGLASTAADAFIADTINPKQQWWDALQGTYNNQPFNMPTDIFQLMGRSPAYSSNVTDRCAGQNLYNCPGSTYPKCSGNGICDRTVGTCTCAPGWLGTTCASASCPKSSSGATCSGHGACNSAVTPPECACWPGYFGTACENTVSSVPAPQCPNGCSLKSGTCNQTVTGAYECICYKGWTGVDCSLHDFGFGSVNIQQGWVGCLKQPNFTLAGPVVTTQTNQKCRYYCAVRGYKYAGTTAGNKCTCGNSFASSTTSSSCTTTCAGDAKQACGGLTAVSTYLAGTIYNAGYVGCFIDDATRDLPTLAYESGTNTVDTCRATCAAQRFKFAGVQNGNQCWCGDYIGNRGGKVAESDCGTPCTGDSTYKCGAGWRNSIYSADLRAGYALY